MRPFHCNSALNHSTTGKHCLKSEVSIEWSHFSNSSPDFNVSQSHFVKQYSTMSSATGKYCSILWL